MATAVRILKKDEGRYCIKCIVGNYENKERNE